MRNPKILVIDDDKDLVPIYRMIINPLACVDFVYELPQGIDLIKSNLYDFILIDLFMDNEKSIDWLEFHKEHGQIYHDKMILVTGKGSLDDEIKGHELGLRDYFRKPFNIKLARTIIDKHLKSLMNTSAEMLVKGPFEIDLRKQKVSVATPDGKLKIELTLKEYLLFKYFLINEGRILKREDLIDFIGSTENESYSRSIDVHVSCLRKKLGQFSHFIKTRRSLGYLLEFD